MSSSHRESRRCEATLQSDAGQQSRVTGPIRLPEKDPQGFVDEFNQKYKGLGLEIQALDGREQGSLTPLQGED